MDEFGSGLGFATSAGSIAEKRKNILEKSIKRLFPPEFLNRIDEQIFFNPLSRDDIGKIVEIELKDLRERVAAAGYKLTITAAAKKTVLDAGFDPAYGARPLKRAIQKYIEDPVSEFIIADDKTLESLTGTDTERRLYIVPDKDGKGTRAAMKS